MKSILLVLAGAVAGFAAGAFAMLFFYPFWFPPAEVNEVVVQSESKQLIGSGDFIHPDPDDSVHWGKGSLQVYREANATEFLLESDFEVGPGPDFHVYLAAKQDIVDKAQFNPDEAEELGRLKSFTGSQIYRSDTADALTGHSVVVWCKAFNQLITTANIVE